MWDYLRFVPVVSLGLLIAWVLFLLSKSEQERDDLWDEEEKRQQRVKDLYPDQPSYEERMGVRYGQKDDNDNG